MLKKTGNYETTYVEGKEIPSIHYHIFQPISFVRDGFSTRMGGISEGSFSTLNFSVKMGDTRERVQENFRRYISAHGFQNPVMADQVHGIRVKRVYKEDAGKNVFIPKDDSGMDGLVTNEPGITLVTTFADCVPLYFVDEEHRAIGLSHAGWRGTLAGMARETLKVMNREFGTKPEQVKAAIGPSICVNCYEVSRELAEEFADVLNCEMVYGAEKHLPEWDMNHIAYERDGKFYLNLWAANYQMMCASGIPKEQIALPDLCTCCNDTILFSHRASRGKRGNLCAFLMIEE